jgi:hypothetical protein
MTILIKKGEGKMKKAHRFSLLLLASAVLVGISPTCGSTTPTSKPPEISTATSESGITQPLAETPPSEAPQTQKQKGISYASWWPGLYSEPDADLALANLADTGANWISLSVTQYQDTLNSTVISPTAATPTDADVIHVITQAHGLGLKVMLKPHVDIANDPKNLLWRANIGQDFTEAEWNAWFASYRDFINHYAQLAQTYGVDQFCVGTEFISSESRATDWREVITGVRSYYSGPLTYAASQGDETNIAWWDAVDYIGVDAYYELASENDPTVAEMKAAWQPHISTLKTLASTWNKPIIFTEIGYRSLDGSSQHPWDPNIGGIVDLQEQADAYQATFESVYNQPWFAGMYWWAWETDLFQGGPCDYKYTPYDKPAEEVLRAWYGAPRASKPTPQPDYSRNLVIYTDGPASGWEDWSWDANVDLASNSPVYSGTQAISITAQAWGTLQLRHSEFDSTPYYWLEFHVRKSSTAQQLGVFVIANDSELRTRPVDYCRYTDGQPIEPGVWTRVRIPLSDLNASDRLLQSVCIRNLGSQPSSFWVDEIRLVAASEAH